ncbi:MAG: efflux RND transporter periplasmic adaptor subunit [Pirellulaceae bacterium]|nr:efflux RND transporter periplasmic adaptor subunit [Pirellulaceae bacterium]
MHKQNKHVSHTRRLMAVVCLGIGCLGIGCIGCDSSSSKPTQSAANKPKPSVTVATPVMLPIVEWDEFVGRLEPIETVQVRSRVSGYLASTNFEEGQVVHSGDVIAIIDQRPFLAEVSRSRANLKEAEAQLVQAQALVAQARADAQRAIIHRDLTKKQLERNNQLIKQNATALQDLEISQAEFSQAEADVVVANSRIDSALSAVVAAEATISIGQANLQLAELNLTYTEIRAPIDGRISSRYVTEGNLVSGGTNDSTLLTTIVSLNPIHCAFDADEQTFLKYSQLSRDGKRPNNRELRNPVYVALSNEHEGFPHQGYIDFIDNRLDEMTGTIRGRAILPNDSLELTPGLFARVRLPGSQRYEATLIPDKAIGTDQAEKFVLTVDSADKVVRKVVTLGPMSHGLRIIRNGLTREDRVILSGLQRARPGMDVLVTNETITPGKESLPDDYEPVAPDQLLSTKRSTAGNVSVPAPEPGANNADSTNAVPRTARTQP